MPDRLGGLGGHLSDLDQRDRYFPVPDGCENFLRNWRPRPTYPQKQTPARPPASGILHEAVDLLTILLNARGAQAGEPVTIDGVLPGEKFLDRERIAAARLFERQKAASHRCHDFGLAADHPTLGP